MTSSDIVLSDSRRRPRSTSGSAKSPGIENAYAELRRRITAAGLIDRDYRYYVARGLVTYALFAASIVLAFVLPPGPGWAALASIGIGFTSVQVALLGHDAGHLAVFKSTRANQALGSICWSLSTGIGFWYWYDRHNRHHAFTNDSEADPDLQGAGLIAHTPESAMSRRGWRRIATHYQAFLYFLYSPLIAFAFRLEGWIFAFQQLRGRRRITEIALLFLSVAAWLSPIAFTGLSWLGVFLASQTVAGLYLALLIAPNHKGMPVWTKGARLSFLERQVLSSRNVAPNPFWDFVFGGLNYQIEHHLFPRMPRSHFRKARSIVMPFCLEHGLPYEEMSAFDSYRTTFASLHRVGRIAGESLG